MNKVKRLAIGAVAGAVIFGSMAFPAFAAQPADPNCLGDDISDFTQVINPFGGFVNGLAQDGGLNDEVLTHLQGPAHNPFSTCPNDGFPTPLP